VTFTITIAAAIVAGLACTFAVARAACDVGRDCAAAADATGVASRAARADAARPSACDGSDGAGDACGAASDGGRVGARRTHEHTRARLAARVRSSRDLRARTVPDGAGCRRTARGTRARACASRAS